MLASEMTCAFLCGCFLEEEKKPSFYIRVYTVIVCYVVHLMHTDTAGLSISPVIISGGIHCWACDWTCCSDST